MGCLNISSFEPPRADATSALDSRSRGGFFMWTTTTRRIVFVVCFVCAAIIGFWVGVSNPLISTGGPQHISTQP